MAVEYAVVKHNQTVLQALQPGDLVEFDRNMYYHWAVYVGDENVIHLGGENGDGLNAADSISATPYTISGKLFSKATVKMDSFWDVAGASKANKNNSKDKRAGPFNRSTVVERAVERLGETGYNLLWRNCEHFASWCRNDINDSQQVSTFLNWLTVGTGVLATLGIAMHVSKRRTNRHQDE